MTNHHHPSNEELLRHLDGELPRDSTPALERHLEACADCRQQSVRLSAVSGKVAEHAAALLDCHSAVRQRRTLIAALERQAETPPFAWSAVTVRAALAAAACVILAVGLSSVVSKPPTGAPQMAGDVFIALPYSDESLSGEGAVVLQVELPRSAVALAGMPVSDGPSDGRVKAEVMVGADGLARAIRFLN
jgi:hypothetical protein